MGHAGLARAVFEKKGSQARLAKAEFIPLVLNGPGRVPRPAKGWRARSINKKMRRYSRTFRKTTSFRPVGNRLQVVLP